VGYPNVRIRQMKANCFLARSTQEFVAMSNLKGKVAFVTGASKGIGASITAQLAAAGSHVVINYGTSKTGADQVVSEIEAAGGRAVAIQGDFSKLEDIERNYAEIKRQFGKIDILVNNAGVYQFGPVESTTPEEFHRQFDLNVLGLLLSVREASPLFPAEGGSIINIGSLVASMAGPYSSVYSGTKGAVDSITIALSKELGARNIRVNALNPGLINTEGTTTGGYIQGDFADNARKLTPLGRLGRPQDIASIAVFLASEESGWLTGHSSSPRGDKRNSRSASRMMHVATPKRAAKSRVSSAGGRAQALLLSEETPPMVHSGVR
jgi:3-oxoacyl-[acyl-carrier protein] reductase